MPDATTPPPDRGALSGLVAGISFIGGIGGANALAPYPRPGASPSQLRQYFTHGQQVRSIWRGHRCGAGWLWCSF